MRLLPILLLFAGSCGSRIEQRPEQKDAFLEVRIARWTALEGGEILVMRKVNDEWSAMLLGDGTRFSCLYQKSVKPKSGWDNLWVVLQTKGLLEIPGGNYSADGWTDGSGFIVDVFYQDKLKRYSFFLPERVNTRESRQILDIGNLISREFDTPVFAADYDRGKVGDYLINACKEYKNRKF
jgi:hypothetical protein